VAVSLIGLRSARPPGVFVRPLLSLIILDGPVPPSARRKGFEVCWHSFLSYLLFFPFNLRYERLLEQRVLAPLPVTDRRLRPLTYPPLLMSPPVPPLLFLCLIDAPFPQIHNLFPFFPLPGPKLLNLSLPLSRFEALLIGYIFPHCSRRGHLLAESFLNSLVFLGSPHSFTRARFLTSPVSVPVRERYGIKGLSRGIDFLFS